MEALLTINLWPLLIVLFSALLPGERLLARHVVGACAGLLGTVMIITASNVDSSVTRFRWGYVTAFSCALIWSGYSVLNRRVAGDAPTEAVTAFCLATALLALLVSFLVEQPRWPQGTAWLALLAMGLGPVGAAFYCWDYATKRGDLRVLGSSAYAAPLIGAALLMLLGRGEPSFRILVAAILIIGGAALASGDLFRSRV